jgi:hypothetical protein
MQYVIIPQSISRKAFLSIQSILMVAILAYYLDYIRLCILLNGLYITSLLHWNKVYNYSLIKIIDILFATGTVYSITYYDSNRFQKQYVIIWNLSITISICAFIINEILFYYQVLNYKNQVLNYKNNLTKLTITKYHYFSLEYAYPNTRTRELYYYRSVYTHMIFLHILPTATCAYCAIMSII